MTSIGQILADARRKRKMTVKDVEQAIKIRAKYITALERDAFDQISGEAYIVGFLKTYAQWLEIDASALLDRYREQTGSAIKSAQVSQGPAADDPQPRRGNRFVFITVIAAALILAAAKIMMLVLPAVSR
ncbi:MAG: helix-turn-helix domain-containing protein [Actinomycetota bacterium]|nr:helix-turn-helix domain-containing protein [Actinomycetota bacterium]